MLDFQRIPVNTDGPITMCLILMSISAQVNFFIFHLNEFYPESVCSEF